MNPLVPVTSPTQVTRKPALAVLPSELGQYLTFQLGGEMFALGILAIKEIIEYRELTVVPMMPNSVRGVINLRGAVVPVVDLMARFGRPASEPGKRTCFVIVEVLAGQQTQVVGLMVDAVSEVLDIAPADIEPPPAFGLNVRSDFVLGMAKVRERFVILVDTICLLAIDDITASAEATSMALS